MAAVIGCNIQVSALVVAGSGEAAAFNGFSPGTETSSERGFSVPWLTCKTPGAVVDPRGSSVDELC